MEGLDVWSSLGWRCFYRDYREVDRSSIRLLRAFSTSCILHRASVLGLHHGAMKYMSFWSRKA